MEKKSKISNPEGTFISHSRVANLHICSRMNFVHQLNQKCCIDAHYRKKCSILGIFTYF